MPDDCWILSGGVLFLGTCGPIGRIRRLFKPTPMRNSTSSLSNFSIFKTSMSNPIADSVKAAP